MAGGNLKFGHGQSGMLGPLCMVDGYQHYGKPRDNLWVNP